MRIQEFVNPYSNIVLTWLWWSWILPGKLALEGVELEFRWVIPRQAKKKSCYRKIRKVIFQCQKWTLIFQTLDWTKPLPPIQFSLLISDSTPGPPTLRAGDGGQTATEKHLLFPDISSMLLTYP